MNTIKEYDTNGNLIHYKDSEGGEAWWTYDENNNLTHYRDSLGGEKWWTYYDDNKEDNTSLS